MRILHPVLNRDEHQRRDRLTAVAITRRECKRGCTACHNIWQDKPIRYSRLCLNPFEELFIFVLVKSTTGSVIAPRAVVANPSGKACGVPVCAVIAARYEQTPPGVAHRRKVAPSAGMAGATDHHQRTAQK